MHINGIGSHTPNAKKMDSEIIRQSDLLVIQKKHVLKKQATF